MLDSITVVISREQITVLAAGDQGIAKMAYRGDRNFETDYIFGNFEEEPSVNEHEDLLEAVVCLEGPLLAVWQELNKQ